MQNEANSEIAVSRPCFTEFRIRWSVLTLPGLRGFAPSSLSRDAPLGFCDDKCILDRRSRCKVSRNSRYLYSVITRVLCGWKRRGDLGACLHRVRRLRCCIVGILLMFQYPIVKIDALAITAQYGPLERIHLVTLQVAQDSMRFPSHVARNSTHPPRH